MLQVGHDFPDFSLQDQNGEVVEKKDLLGQDTIVYFYPKDDTPGCTVEACEFQSSAGDLKSAGKNGVRVVGVSPDNSKSHKKFADKFGLAFTLLADVDHALSEACEVWVEKSMYGKKYMGVERTTFLLDASGQVKKVFSKVKPQGHAAEILQSLA
jgi:peroxiredoxin Q/BCP